MKVFQIKNNICYNEVTEKFRTAASTANRFPPSVLFVDAPDYVYAGWGYDDSKDGDERFVQPQPPEGWLYDAETGTFYEEGKTAPSASVAEPTTEQQITDLQAMAVDYEYRLTLLELGV
jgi:hypothetical protein